MGGCISADVTSNLPEYQPWGRIWPFRQRQWLQWCWVWRGRLGQPWYFSHRYITVWGAHSHSLKGNLLILPADELIPAQLSFLPFFFPPYLSKDFRDSEKFQNSVRNWSVLKQKFTEIHTYTSYLAPLSNLIIVWRRDNEIVMNTKEMPFMSV